MISTIAGVLMLGVGVEIPEFPRYECIEANFVQHREVAVLKRTLILEGRLRIEQDGFMLWQVEKPYHYSYEINGHAIEEVLPDGTRRTIAAQQAPWLEATSQMMVALLAGDTDSLRQYFDIQVFSESDDTRKIILTPNNNALAAVLGHIEMVWTDRPIALSFTTTNDNSSQIMFHNVVACNSDGDTD